jgi:hypothetical protein
LDEAIAEFERCWPWLKEALTSGAFVYHGKQVWLTHTKEDVWDRIIDGRCFFWPGENCVFVTEIWTSPTGLKTHNLWLTGGEKGRSLREVISMEAEISKWASQMGCHHQISNGRKGWLRAFPGYRETGVRKSKSLLK